MSNFNWISHVQQRVV